MEAGEFLSPATRACTRCTKTMPKEREVDLVHHEPCHRSMDQRILVYREPHSHPQPGTEPYGAQMSHVDGLLARHLAG